MDNQKVNTETTDDVDEIVESEITDFIVIRDVIDDTVIISQRG